MDARCVDRPAAAVLATRSEVVSAIVLVLAERGYDVYLPVHRGAVGPGGPWGYGDHPRLHPVPVADGAAAEEVADAVQRSGSPLAFMVCDTDDDLLERSRLVLGLRRWLRHSGVLVVGRPDSPDRPTQVAGVRVSWLTPGRASPFPRQPPRRGALLTSAVRTASRSLDGLHAGRSGSTGSPSLFET